MILHTLTLEECHEILNQEFKILKKINTKFLLTARGEVIDYKGHMKPYSFQSSSFWPVVCMRHSSRTIPSLMREFYNIPISTPCRPLDSDYLNTHPSNYSLTTYNCKRIKLQKVTWLFTTKWRIVNSSNQTEIKLWVNLWNTCQQRI